MTERDFCLWLQGFIEISGVKEFDEKSLKIIKARLELVTSKQPSAYSVSTWGPATPGLITPYMPSVGTNVIYPPLDIA